VVIGERALYAELVFGFGFGFGLGFVVLI